MNRQSADQAQTQAQANAAATSPWTEIFQAAQDQAKQQESHTEQRPQRAHAADSEAYRPTHDALSAIFHER